jgi:hypothetical protein
MKPRVTRLAKRRRASRDPYRRAVRVYGDLVGALRDFDPAQRQEFITLVISTLEAFRAAAAKGGAR